MPELIGVCRHKPRLKMKIKIRSKILDKSTLLYTNKVNVIILAQSDEFHVESQRYFLVHKPFRNFWVFQDSMSNRILAWNEICNDANTPINGACQYGWVVQQEKGWFYVDVTAPAICNTPQNL